jgi:hypothetical protein
MAGDPGGEGHFQANSSTGESSNLLVQCETNQRHKQTNEIHSGQTRCKVILCEGDEVDLRTV